MLSLRAEYICVVKQTKPLQHIEEHGVSDGQHRFTIGHAEVALHHLLLTWRKVWMGAYYDVEDAGSLVVLLGRRASLCGVPDVEYSRQQNVLELSSI